jgi:hypothetical protein
MTFCETTILTGLINKYNNRNINIIKYDDIFFAHSSIQKWNSPLYDLYKSIHRKVRNDPFLLRKDPYDIIDTNLNIRFGKCRCETKRLTFILIRKDRDSPECISGAKEFRELCLLSAISTYLEAENKNEIWFRDFLKEFLFRTEESEEVHEIVQL